MSLKETLANLGAFLEENNIGVSEDIDHTNDIAASIIHGVMTRMAEAADFSALGDVLSESINVISENEGSDPSAVRAEVCEVFEAALKQLRGEEG